MSKLLKQLKLNSDSKKADGMKRFFKVDSLLKDQFIGVSIPQIRKIIKDLNLSIDEIKESLTSQVHQERLAALFYFIAHFNLALKNNDKNKAEDIFLFLNTNHIYIDNWDLVDSVVYKIHAKYIEKYFDEVKINHYLNKLIKTNNLWLQRTAIVLNIYFVKKGITKYFLSITKNFLKKDVHHILLKANGWVLREMGNKDSKLLVDFLKENIKIIPSITFSYATEKLSKNEKHLLINLRNK